VADCPDLGTRVAAFRHLGHEPCRSALDPAQCAAAWTEIDELLACFERALAELADIGAHDIVQSYLPQAAAELGAVVPHIEIATLSIIEQCEQLERRFAGSAAEPIVQAAASQIYEACVFQDITGQRIGKVTQLLRAVEHSLQSVLWMCGRTGATSRQFAPESPLSGPQLGEIAMSQHAIDEVLRTAP
jgi:chemotaxis protein CheZ